MKIEEPQQEVVSYSEKVYTSLYMSEREQGPDRRKEELLKRLDNIDKHANDAAEVWKASENNPVTKPAYKAGQIVGEMRSDIMGESVGKSRNSYGKNSELLGRKNA